MCLGRSRTRRSLWWQPHVTEGHRPRWAWEEAKQIWRTEKTEVLLCFSCEDETGSRAQHRRQGHLKEGRGRWKVAQRGAAHTECMPSFPGPGGPAAQNSGYGTLLFLPQGLSRAQAASSRCPGQELPHNMATTHLSFRPSSQARAVLIACERHSPPLLC